MSEHVDHLQETAKRLEESKTAPAPVLIGFDGFVDEILHVVDKRQSVDAFTRLENLDTFGQRLSAAAGYSCNVELVEQQRKLGGNGPILANAMAALSHPVSYIGCIGKEEIHPVFRDFAAACEDVVSLSDPAITHAIEFTNGKVMLGRMATLADVTFERIVAVAGRETLSALTRRAAMVGFVNWTMLPHMNGIMRGFADLFGESRERPHPDGKTVAFVDLADPAKRTKEDLVGATKELMAMDQEANVILGLNEKESVQIAEVLGQPKGDLASRATEIRSALGLTAVVIHPTREAHVATAEGTWRIDGPFTENPVLTTGAGDVFNSGFCHGWLLGLDPASCLATGVAASGFYVRKAKPATHVELTSFMRDWAAGKVDS